MISHVVLNVRDLSAAEHFYLRCLAPLGVAAADREPGDFVRLSNGRDLVIVLAQVESRFLSHPYHRKAAGLHHIALRLDSREVLEQVAEHLRAIGVPLRGGSIHSSTYRKGYASVFFEDLDRILIELVHHDDYYFSLEPP